MVTFSPAFIANMQSASSLRASGTRRYFEILWDEPLSANAARAGDTSRTKQCAHTLHVYTKLCGRSCRVDHLAHF
jgi:hypothetical protein